MTTIVIIAAIAILIYLFGKIALAMAEQRGEDKKLAEIHREMIETVKKQAQIMAEAKTVEKVIDDLESGRF